MNDMAEWQLQIEGRLKGVETTTYAMNHALNGNGRPGFIEIMSAYISEQRGAWKTIKYFGGVFALIVSLLLGWLTYRDSQRKTTIVLPEATQSKQQKPQAADGINDGDKSDNDFRAPIDTLFNPTRQGE